MDVTNGTTTARCCIAGGGPAGMVLGYLLARAGIDVIVLEKHADFLRDFRGDTVHPSTLQIFAELGLLDDFLQIPHQELRRIGGSIEGTPVTIADLRYVPTRCKFVALMPQWDLLDFLAGRARRYPNFRLLMRTQAIDLIEEGGRVAGVRANTPDGDIAIRAELVVGADGRHSTVRARAGLEFRDFGAPIDVLWMRLSKRRDERTQETFGYFLGGRLLVAIDRGDYFQCGFVIPKGGYDALKRRGIEALRADMAAVAPALRDRVAELKDWGDVSLLTVTIDRLTRWYRPGLVCIGDAAHAMSPMGGVGINLAIQDAVAAANILAATLAGRGPVGEAPLAAIQRRREFPTKVTQALQVFAQERIFAGVSMDVRPSPRRARLPFAVRLLRALPILRAIPAYVIGVGVRPEHVHTGDARAAATRSGA